MPDPGSLRGSRLVRDVLVAVVAAVLVAGIGAGIVLRQRAIYRSASLLLIDQPSALAAATDAGIVDKLSRLRVKYTGLVQTSLIARPVGERLNLPERVIAASALVLPIPQTLLLQVQAQAFTADLARRIADATGEEIAKYAKAEQDADGIPPDKQFTLTVVSQAPSGSKVAPTSQRLLAVSLTSGLLMLAGVLAGLRLLGPAVRARRGTGSIDAA